MIAVTACYYPTTAPISRMLESAARHGVRVVPYGVGQQCGGAQRFFRMKVLGLREVLAGASDRHVLYLDGSDTLFVAGEAAIMEGYDAARRKSDILLGGDRRTWPIRKLAGQFARSEPGQWKAPCPGVIVAERTVLIAALDLLQEERESLARFVPQHLGYDDQALWQAALVRGFVDAAVDSECRVSVTLKNARAKDLYWADGRLTMSGGIQPAILHCNGHRKADRERYRDLVRRCG